MHELEELIQDFAFNFMPVLHIIHADTLYDIGHYDFAFRLELFFE